MPWTRATPSQVHSSGGETISVTYAESPGLLWLSIKNFLLTVVTLSIYRFWAKTHVRRHIWANVSINGDSLEYTGTGKELFFGALIVFLIIVLPAIAISLGLRLTLGETNPITVTVNLLIALIVFLLYGMAIYRARRYRLSRTLWRGIRSTLTGSPTSFSLLYFASLLLRIITLGWSTPAMNLNIQQRLIGDMTFGDRSFLFNGSAGPLYRRFALCWFLTPVVVFIASIAAFGVVAALFGPELQEFKSVIERMAEAPEEDAQAAGFAVIAGLFAAFFAIYVAYAVLWTFYTAREMNLFASYTVFDDARFELDATVSSLIKLWLGNLAIMIFTLGIGQPYVLQRLVRYLCDRLTVNGTVNLTAIAQSTAALDKRGEGLVEAFDIDAF